VAWAAGIALVAFTVRRVGWRTVVEAVAGVGPGILWLVAANAAATVLMGLPWWLLLPREERPSPGAAIVSRFAATGLNALLPLLAIGEITRLLWVRREQRPAAIAAIVVDRLMFVVASAAAVFVGAVAILFIPAAPGRLGWVAAGFAAALLVATAVALRIGARRDPVAWLRRVVRPARKLLARLHAEDGDGGGASAGAGGEDRTDAALHRILRGPRGTLALALALHLAARVFVTLEVYAAVTLLGREIGAAASLVLAAVPLAMGVVSSVVPGQLGVQETAQGAIAALIGLGGATGVLLVLLQRVRQLLMLPLTFAALAMRPQSVSAGDGDRGSDRAAPSAAIGAGSPARR
jgi:hypothetical protein